ncbi:site-specific recombinase [Azohydromonas caseinilytica]|uniref:Site-specific recombinase n=1 Tax=Azohydromonas caseinilytica TaxID=2728836 RepID=A0A848F4W7_9BURK|nr:recombinase [Azohydromonas caseinilytica]NML13755.1 site-specific recombinase [Azohydromonas caseinilytica]
MRFIGGGAQSTSAWDLTALLNAADPRAPRPERHLWLTRLLEWLRHDPPRRGSAGATPPALLRLRHLLNVLEQHPQHREAVHGLIQRFWGEVDAAALFAEFGFPHRVALTGELLRRLRERVLPSTPDTTDLAELFPLLFEVEDAEWIEAIDEATLQRLAALMAPRDEVEAAAAEAAAGDLNATPLSAPRWRDTMADAVTLLVSAVHGAGLSPPLRRRMSPALLADEPFRQLTRASERLRDAELAGDRAALLQEAHYLRALLDACRRAADSIEEHLEEFGVSVDIVYDTEQLRQRTLRIERLLDCLVSPGPARELQLLTLQLVQGLHEREGLRSLLTAQYGQLARKMTERSAETGEHYITRDRAEYAAMYRSAAGGGLVMAGTTFLKFAITALGLTAFWSGLLAGFNYAASFVLIMLLHWTVATKQPAMTAPAMAARLRGSHRDEEGFVDEVVHLIRSQSAGILGNLTLVAPVVLAVQALAWGVMDAPLVDAKQATYVLHSLSLLGPTPLFAAFTGVLLFGSSVIAGWVENWFVFNRLDSAIAWNPRIVARLGAARAQRWAAWARANVSGLAANISLGLMLGLTPALAGFFALPLDVRHVTLSTGQLAAAAGALGWGIVGEPAFWWCVAGIVLTALLNVGVSFYLAFRLALRARGLHLKERAHLAAAIRRRIRHRPLSLLVPER